MQKDLRNYWGLPTSAQRAVINEVLPQTKQCECKELAPVHPGTKYTHCVKCHAMFEIITPYVVKRVPTTS